jgi:hypothetical protein
LVDDLVARSVVAPRDDEDLVGPRVLANERDQTARQTLRALVGRNHH